MRSALPQKPGHHRGLIWQRDEWSLGPDRAWVPALGGGLFLTALVIFSLGWIHQASGVAGGSAAGGDTSLALRFLPVGPIAPPEVISIRGAAAGESGAPEGKEERRKGPGRESAPAGMDLLAGKNAAGEEASLESGSPGAAGSGGTARDTLAAAGTADEASGGYQGGGAASRGLKVVRRTRVLDLALIDEPAKKKPRERRVAVPPKVSYRPQPVYPDSAEKRGLEGVVTLRVLVSEKGTVAKHEFRGPEGGSEDQLFVKSVLDVLPQWQFQPALDEEGKPIEAWREYRMVFKMGGSGR